MISTVFKEKKQGCQELCYSLNNSKFGAREHRIRIAWAKNWNGCSWRKAWGFCETACRILFTVVEPMRSNDEKNTFTELRDGLLKDMKRGLLCFVLFMKRGCNIEYRRCIWRHKFRKFCKYTKFLEWWNKL